MPHHDLLLRGRGVGEEKDAFVLTIFCVFEILARTWRRGSGTATIATLGSIVQKGKFAAWALPFFTSALNRVDCAATIILIEAILATKRLNIVGARRSSFPDSSPS